MTYYNHRWKSRTESEYKTILIQLNLLSRDQFTGWLNLSKFQKKKGTKTKLDLSPLFFIKIYYLSDFFSSFFFFLNCIHKIVLKVQHTVKFRAENAMGL